MTILLMENRPKQVLVGYQQSRYTWPKILLCVGSITAMRYLLPCVKDGDYAGCAVEGEVAPQLDGLCGKNGEGYVPPELACMERAGCVPTELAAQAE